MKKLAKKLWSFAYVQNLMIVGALCLMMGFYAGMFWCSHIPNRPCARKNT